MRWQDNYRDKLITAKQAAELITSGSDVLFPVSNHPKDIILEISRRYADLQNITLTSHWVEDYPFLHPEEHPEMTGSFLVKDPLTVRFSRQAVREKRIDWQPTAFGLSNGERQKDTHRGRLYHFKDFFFFKVTPPDDEGHCSFGPRHWYTPSACRTAKVKIAEIDPSIPWVYGEYVNIDDIDYLVEAPEESSGITAELASPVPPPEEWEVAQVVGANAASLINDGDTVEIGVGTAAEAVLGFLEDKNDLGVDTELTFVQTVDLVRKGVITGKRKTLDNGKVVSSCFWTYPGDPAVPASLEYISKNRLFEFRDISTICNVRRISSQDNMVAINNILAIDLLGQVVLTHVKGIPISGPGGQVEYCIGAHYSRGGRSIAMTSSTALGGKVSRIVPKFEEGAVVMIPMVFVDYVVTEYGIANLDCKSQRERTEALISIAHPDFRPELLDAAKTMFWP